MLARCETVVNVFGSSLERPVVPQTYPSRMEATGLTSERTGVGPVEGIPSAGTKPVARIFHCCRIVGQLRQAHNVVRTTRSRFWSLRVVPHVCLVARALWLVLSVLGSVPWTHYVDDCPTLMFNRLCGSLEDFVEGFFSVLGFKFKEQPFFFGCVQRIRSRLRVPFGPVRRCCLQPRNEDCGHQ